MDLGTGALLVGAAVIGGGLNAVAGGGSFFTFPALVFAGIQPIPANATSTLALWPGSLASAAAFRRELETDRRVTFWFGAASVLGGVAGALLLVVTPERAFEALIPFLLLLATVLFAVGPRLTAYVRSRPESRSLPFGAIVAVQVLISIYGGYFGGGMGILMLATFALFGMDDIHRMNGLKAVLAVGINGVAILTFVARDVWLGTSPLLIQWGPGLVMTLGAIAGGYGAAAFSRRIDPRWLRRFIILIGSVLTVVFARKWLEE